MFTLKKAQFAFVVPGTGVDAVCVSRTRRRARAKGKEGPREISKPAMISDVFLSLHGYF